MHFLFCQQLLCNENKICHDSKCQVQYLALSTLLCWQSPFKKNENIFKSCAIINTVIPLTRHAGIILIQIFVNRKERLIFIHNAYPIPSGTSNFLLCAFKLYYKEINFTPRAFSKNLAIFILVIFQFQHQ